MIPVKAKMAAQRFTDPARLKWEQCLRDPLLDLSRPNDHGIKQDRDAVIDTFRIAGQALYRPRPRRDEPMGVAAQRAIDGVVSPKDLKYLQKLLSDSQDPRHRLRFSYSGGESNHIKQASISRQDPGADWGMKSDLSSTFHDDGSYQLRDGLELHTPWGTIHRHLVRRVSGNGDIDVGVKCGFKMREVVFDDVFGKTEKALGEVKIIESDLSFANKLDQRFALFGAKYSAQVLDFVPPAKRDVFFQSRFRLSTGDEVEENYEFVLKDDGVRIKKRENSDKSQQGTRKSDPKLFFIHGAENLVAEAYDFVIELDCHHGGTFGGFEIGYSKYTGQFYGYYPADIHYNQYGEKSDRLIRSEFHQSWSGDRAFFQDHSTDLYQSAVSAFLELVEQD